MSIISLKVTVNVRKFWYKKDRSINYDMHYARNDARLKKTFSASIYKK